MSARSLLAELRRRDRVLAVTRWLNFGLFAAMLCVVPFDGRDRFERAGVERVAACGVGELGTGAGTSPPASATSRASAGMDHASALRAADPAFGTTFRVKARIASPRSCAS